MTMSGKDKSAIPKNRNDSTDVKQSLDFNYVSEGSKVILDAHDFIQDRDINTIKSYSWKQPGGILVVDLHNANTQSVSFTAPYIKDNAVNISLNFELTTTDDNGITTMHNTKVIVKRVQRAIIFQGGVSLGAYEVGVFRALVEKLTKEDSKRGINGRPLFDIVAGTSIGAMNAAVIVSHIVKDNGSWNEDLVRRLENFWQYQRFPTIADDVFKNPFFSGLWDFSHDMNKIYKQYWDTALTEIVSPYAEFSPYLRTVYDFWRDCFIDGWYIPATGEAARRYYSAWQFKTQGTPHVASGILPWSKFGKFFDFSDISNIMPRPDNKHLSGFSLKETLEQFVHFPLKSTEGQPRFLLVTVDVQTGDAITFDSYSEKAKYHNDTDSFIYNKKGIEIEHVLASGTFPDFFDYPEFEVENENVKSSKKERRIFWDGGFRSNTPLRELIQAHTDYWRNRRTNKKDGQDIPDLEVYIADLWPSELSQQPVSFDLDFVEDRKWDIIFGDRTDYDEKVANVVSDYVDLAKQLRSLAKKKGASDDEINDILEKRASSRSRPGHPPRKYANLLDDRFRLTKIVRIDHKDDGNEVVDKVFDYTYKTVGKLMKDGYYDTLIQMDIRTMEDAIIEIFDRNGRNNAGRYLQRLEGKLQQIQRSIKIENGNGAMKLINEIEDFISEVQSITDDVENGLLKEEKTFLIDAVKQLQAVVEKKSDPTPTISQP